MKSVHETFPVWDGGERAAGFDGSLDSGRQAAIRAPRNNVIDLAAWKAANRELWEEPEGFGPEYSEAAPEPPARRARRSRRRAYVDPELFSILGVVGVLAALMARVLVF